MPSPNTVERVIIDKIIDNVNDKYASLVECNFTQLCDTVLFYVDGSFVCCVIVREGGIRFRYGNCNWRTHCLSDPDVLESVMGHIFVYLDDAVCNMLTAGDVDYIGEML